VTITRGNINDKIHISLHGMPRRTSFSVSPGGTTTFGPTHQYPIGLWFNNPKVPGGRSARPPIRIPEDARSAWRAAVARRRAADYCPHGGHGQHHGRAE
jgi:hypothetical protein